MNTFVLPGCALNSETQKRLHNCKVLLSSDALNPVNLSNSSKGLPPPTVPCPPLHPAEARFIATASFTLL